MKKTLSTLMVSVISLSAIAQHTATDSKYDQHKAFSSTSTFPSRDPEYRSVNGNPGKKYWQNKANYRIDVTLDTTIHIVEGSVEIKYINSSPDELHYVWLQLDQNIFREDARAALTSKLQNRQSDSGNFSGGFKIKSVSVKEKAGELKSTYVVSDTRMQISLSKPVKENGGSITFRIEYSFQVPENRKIRMGRLKSSEGWIYQIAQWYPRMCVYDDLQGWNTLPYLGTGEFYLEYGDFDFTIRVPSDHLVVASGELVNPEEVLTKNELKQFYTAQQSESTVIIRSVDDVHAKRKISKKGYVSWHFRMQNSRDVVWASSPAFVWDAAKINLPGGQTALAQSVYPVESTGKNKWGRSTEFIKGVIEYCSEKWYTYPYKNAIHVAGKFNGSEYPGMVFSNVNYQGAELFNIVNHEFCHYLFPMIVGSNERSHAWMDEGFTTFINILCAEYFNAGEFKLPKEVFNLHKAAQDVFNEQSEPVMTLPDVMQPRNLNKSQYGKTAVALVLLRTQILGEQRFDYAFKSYISNWAYKHPEPFDFFKIMDNAAGESLEWFWKGWFINNWKLDQAVKSVEYIKNDHAQGSIITIENLDQMVMPAIIEIKESTGSSNRITLPVEIWQRGSVWSFKYPSTSPIQSVIIDPDFIFPDKNAVNNVYQSGQN
jgi:hypothetical protein